ncbi:MAG: nucleotide exchange factor GrpE [Candidatus Lokiarchaeota archaeon]|nr:nucleotide exchange factor GrpE [Candidatus Lokiarchaeota archaeon]
MPRKKKDKDKMSDESTKKEEAQSPTKEVTKVKDKENGESAEEKEEQETKLLVGNGQKVLEYHDLDELLTECTKLKEESKKDKDRLTELQKEVEIWKGKHMRLQAEFENAQKRWSKNQQNLRKENIAYTLKSFLPLYDSFKKALDGDDKNQAVLKQFYDQFMGILRFHQAEPIKVNVNDPFDYSLHEALSTLERDDLPNNSIIEIIQDGWKIDKDVLRFAKVIVSREPSPPKPEPEPESKPEPELETEAEDNGAQDNGESKKVKIETEHIEPEEKY